MAIGVREFDRLVQEAAAHAPLMILYGPGSDEKQNQELWEIARVCMSVPDDTLIEFDGVDEKLPHTIDVDGLEDLDGLLQVVQGWYIPDTDINVPRLLEHESQHVDANTASGYRSAFKTSLFRQAATLEAARAGNTVPTVQIKTVTGQTKFMKLALASTLARPWEPSAEVDSLLLCLLGYGNDTQTVGDKVIQYNDLPSTERPLLLPLSYQLHDGPLVALQLSS